MNPTPNAHPDFDQWLDWVHERGDLTDRLAFEAHFDVCMKCKTNMPMLNDLRRSRNQKQWTLPQAKTLDIASAFPRVAWAPTRSASPLQLYWAPSDVRAQTLTVSENRSLNEAIPGAEISIEATPPGETAFWTIEGCVWLHDESIPRAELVISHGEHVVVHTSVQSGEFFRIEEILPPGWELEVHLPDGRVLQLVDDNS